MYRPQVTRGSLTNYRTGEQLLFLYNPSTIKRSKGSNRQITAIPGQSDPLIQWVSGKEQTISFELELCGESMIRLRGDGSTVDNEIAFLEQFEYPVEDNDDREAQPDMVIFSFGKSFSPQLCHLEVGGVTMTEFDPELGTLRAKVEIKLIREVTKQRTADTIWRGRS